MDAPQMKPRVEKKNVFKHAVVWRKNLECQGLAGTWGMVEKLQGASLQGMRRAIEEKVLQQLRQELA